MPVSRNGILYPLDALYARAGVAGPVVKRTTAGRIPSPYKSLLVHENEMTSTLERHFGGRVTVRVLGSFSRGRSYFRRVLLAMESTGRPVLDKPFEIEDLVKAVSGVVAAQHGRPE